MKFSDPLASIININLNKENIDVIRNFYQNLLTKSSSQIEMNYYLLKLEFFDNLSLALHAVDDMEFFLKHAAFTKSQPE